MFQLSMSLGFPSDFQMNFFSDGYTADKVKYLWSKGAIQSLKLHKIRLPDFQIKEAYVTNRLESYATGRWKLSEVADFMTVEA